MATDPTPLLDPSGGPKPLRRLLPILLACYAVFLGNYAAFTLLTPFFPTSAAALFIGEELVGAVFAAYPLATAASMPLPPLMIRVLGCRATIALGLVANAAGSLLFGLAGRHAWGSPAALAAALCACRALGGAGAGVAESGCLTVISTLPWEGNNNAKALAGVEVVVGVGMALGSGLGGILFAAGGDTPLGAFLLPFVCAAALSALLLPPLLLLPPPRAGGDGDDDESDAAARKRGCFPSAGYGAVALSVLLVAVATEAINPILEPHLRAKPYGMDTAQIGYLFAAYSAAYTLGALPVGALADRALDAAPSSGRLKVLMAGGWLACVGAFAMLGPLADAAPTPAAATWLAVLSLPLLGAASAAVIVPSMPDMQSGLAQDDEAAKAVVCSLWNGVFSLGCTVGPLASAALADATSFTTTISWLCVGTGLVGAAMLGASAMKCPAS